MFGLKQKMKSICRQNFNYFSTVSGVCFYIKSSYGNFTVAVRNCYRKDHKDHINVGGVLNWAEGNIHL